MGEKRRCAIAYTGSDVPVDSLPPAVEAAKDLMRRAGVILRHPVSVRVVDAQFTIEVEGDGASEILETLGFSRPPTAWKRLWRGLLPKRASLIDIMKMATPPPAQPTPEPSPTREP